MCVCGYRVGFHELPFALGCLIEWWRSVKGVKGKYTGFGFVGVRSWFDIAKWKWRGEGGGWRMDRWTVWEDVCVEDDGRLERRGCVVDR